jgi:hypothetical protein
MDPLFRRAFIALLSSMTESRTVLPKACALQQQFNRPDLVNRPVFSSEERGMVPSIVLQELS